MGSAALFYLVVASAVNAALPGPCVLFTFARTSCSGWRAAVSVSAGVLFADLIWSLLAVWTLTGLLLVSEQLLFVLRWTGVAFLFGMAVSLLFPRDDEFRADRHGAAGTNDIISGFVAGASSPYNLVFFLAILPQFAPPVIDFQSAAAMVAALIIGAAGAQALASGLGLVAGNAVNTRKRRNLLERLGGIGLAGFAVLGAVSLS